MAFTAAQLRHLKAKLDPKYVRTRQSGGITLHYIEGWHAIGEANRIFGFDGWDRETVSTSCVSSTKGRGDYKVAYTARVRITVRAAKITIVREGCGSGEAKAFTPGQAHDLALKSAETDATKRALASFGNSFGLALYDPELSGVRNGSNAKTAFSDVSHKGPWPLNSVSGEIISSYETPTGFGQALRRRMEKADDIEDLFGFWQQNVGTVRTLHRMYRWYSGKRGVDGIALVAHLKACARSFAEAEKAKSGKREAQPKPAASRSHNLPAKIDKSVLTLGVPKRIRSKGHLRFVAQQPCLICGRLPSHAHHIRYGQPRGLGLKVSDEFTVPLCAIHHNQNHATGDERCWWQEHKIEPLAIALQLWRTSQGQTQSLASPAEPHRGGDQGDAA